MGRLKSKFRLPALSCAAFFACFAAAAAAQDAPVKWQQPAGLSLRIAPYEEAVRGSPGYAAKLDFVQTEPAPAAAPLYPQAAEIGRFVNAQVLQSLFAARGTSAADSAADYCAGSAWQDNCANELYMKLDDVESVGRFISLRYDYSYMPVGAAHPMHSVFTYNFSLQPLFALESLEQIFDDSAKAFSLLQTQARAGLSASLRRDAGAALSPFEQDMLKQGTADWKDFSAFMLTKTGIKLYFSPYAVAPYAAGTREAEIPYALIKAQLKPFYAQALGLK